LSFLNLTINSQVNVLGVCYGSAILIFEQAPCQHQQGGEGQEKNCLAPCQNWQAVLGKKRSAEICANIRKASKGKKKEDAAKHRAKIGKAVLGKKRSA
jgi:hypothetical protein